MLLGTSSRRRGLLFVAAMTAATGVAGCRVRSEPATVQANGNEVGEFRGFQAISHTIAARVAKVPATFALTRYLAPSAQSATPLLGAYVITNNVGGFENGKANALNMALWHLILIGFAADVGTSCAPPALPPAPTAGQGSDTVAPSSPPVPVQKFSDAFLAKLAPLCAWPAPGAKDETVMKKYWNALMGFQAPASAFTAWRNWFIQHPQYDAMPAEKVLSAMTLAIVMQPYFLLSK